MIGMRWLPTKPLIDYLEETYPGLHQPGYAKINKVSVLAERTGVDRRTFFRWFAGQKGMNWWTGAKVCSGLGIHPAEIWEEW